MRQREGEREIIYRERGSETERGRETNYIQIYKNYIQIYRERARQ